MSSDLHQDRELIGGRWLRWNAGRAANAYTRGLWVPEGEIHARGPQMLVAYLVVTGRAKDLIIRNGENISPKGVATFKAPEEVVIWDALPKNDAGKVLKHQIRAVLVQKT
jgi:acyl-CoA synthetase (AMP-forming)/AMP-acid ligase II